MEAGTLYYDLEITDDKLSGKLKESEEKVEGFGSKLQGAFRDASKVLAGVGAGLTLFAKNATDFTTDSVKSSKMLATQIGTTTTEASRLVAAFGRMGLEADATSQMFGIFSKKIVESTSSSKDNQLATEKLRISIEQTKKSIQETTDKIAKNGDKTGELGLKVKELNNTLQTQEAALNKSADSFAKLGIKTTDAQGKQKDFNTILFEVADKFKDMPNGIDKTALAMELFGRQGKEMIKVLNLGSGGIKELEDQADKLGLTLNEKTIGAISRLVKSQKDLKQQTDAVKIAVGTATAPVLTNFNMKLNEMIALLMNAPKPIKDLTTNTLAFGGPIAGAASGLAAFAGNIGGAMPLISKLGISIKGIGLAFGWVGLIAGIIAALVFLEQKFHFVEAAARFFKPAIDQAVQSLQVAYNFFVTYLLPIFQQIGAYIMTQLKQAWDNLSASVAQISAQLEPFISKSDQLKIVIGALLLPFLVVAAVILGFVAVVAVVIGIIATLINWVSQAINIYFQLSGAVTGAMGQFVGAVIGGLSQVIAWHNNMVANVRGAMAGFGSAVAGGVNSAVSFIQSLPGRVMGVLNSLPGMFYSAGVSMIQGLVNGIASMASAPANAVSSLLGKVKNLLPHSPAKEGPLSGKGWTLYSGMAIVEGLALGISKSASAVYDSMGSVLSNIGGGGSIPIAYSANGRAGTGGVAGATNQMGIGGMIIHGNVNIGDKPTADYFFSRTNQDQELLGMGLAPVGAPV